MYQSLPENNFFHLSRFLDKRDVDKLVALLKRRNHQYKENLNYRSRIEMIESSFHKKAVYKNYSGDSIQIGRKNEITSKESDEILKVLKALIPWRKGPFSLFGIFIDSEWQSYQKWNRLLPHLNNMRSKVICDIGCNNGYYLYKIAHHKPDFVLGIDPTYSFKLMFDYLQQFSREGNLKFELMGFKELTYFKKSFDIIFCMGILYHHKNPIEILEICKHSLKPGGQLILESITIPGDESFSLSPEGSYANMKGIWFLPTYICIKNWLKKLGYSSIHLVSHEEMRATEQRTTEWAPFSSFKEALDPHDPSFTKEGYPRPYRSLYISTMR